MAGKTEGKQPATAASAKTIVKSITKQFRIPLTDQERLDFGEQMARALGQHQEAEEAKKDAVAQFKADSERHRVEATRLGGILQRGYQFRDVECEVTKDMAAGTIRIVRTDTGEEVEFRNLRPDESQGELPV